MLPATAPAVTCFDCSRPAPSTDPVTRVRLGWRREPISPYLRHRGPVDRCPRCVRARIEAEGTRIERALAAAAAPAAGPEAA